MPLTERQRKATTAFKNLPVWNGWKEDEIAANISEVISSNDTSRINKLYSNLGTLPVFEGFSPEEIGGNLSEVFLPPPLPESTVSPIEEVAQAIPEVPAMTPAPATSTDVAITAPPLTKQEPTITALHPEAPEEKGILEEVGELAKTGIKGFAAGSWQAAQSVGSISKWLGNRIGNEKLKEVGTKIHDIYAPYIEQVAPPEEIAGNFEWSHLKEPSYWAYNVMNTVPSFAASMVPGMGAAKVINIGGKALKVSAPVLAKLAVLGGGLAGGGVGGALEGAGTYEEMLKQGSTEEEAARAGEFMAVASGMLNTISVGKMMQKLPDNIVSRMAKRGINASVEAITEFLEEPASAFAEAAGRLAPEGLEPVTIPQTVTMAAQRLKQGAAVLGPSFLLGFFGSGAGAARQSFEQIKSGKTAEEATTIKSPLEKLTPAEKRLRERVAEFNKEKEAKQTLLKGTKIPWLEEAIMPEEDVAPVAPEEGVVMDDQASAIPEIKTETFKEEKLTPAERRLRERIAEFNREKEAKTEIVPEEKISIEQVKDILAEPEITDTAILPEDEEPPTVLPPIITEEVATTAPIEEQTVTKTEEIPVVEEKQKAQEAMQKIPTEKIELEVPEQAEIIRNIDKPVGKDQEPAVTQLGPSKERKASLDNLIIPKVKKGETIPLVSKEEKIKELAIVEKLLRKKLPKFPKVSETIGDYNQVMKERLNIELLIEKTTADRIELVKGAVVDYAKKIGLTREASTRVEIKVKNAKSINDLVKAMAKMDDVLEGKASRRLRIKIVNIIEKVTKRIQKAKKRKTSLAGGEEFVKNFTEYANSIVVLSEKKTEKAQELYDKFFDRTGELKDPDAEIPENVHNEIQNLMRVNLNALSSGGLIKIINDLSTLRKKFRLAHQQYIKERTERTQKNAEISMQEIITAIKKPEKIKSRLQKKSESKITKFIKSYFFSSLRPERIIEYFTNFKKGKFKEIVFDRMKKSTDEEIVNYKKSTKKVVNIHSEINIPNAVNKIFAIFTSEFTNPVTGKKQTEKVSMTLDNMMFVYANSRNPWNRAHMIATLEGNEALMEEIISKLPEKHKKTVEQIWEFYDNYLYPRINKIFKEQYGVDMPQEANYFPILSLETQRAENALVVDLLARYTSRQQFVNKGFVKARVDKESPFNNLDYFGTIIRNIKMSEHYIAFDKPIREIRMLLNNKKLRKVMKAKSEEATRQLDDWLNAMAYGKVEASKQIVDRLSDFLRTNAITSVLGFNLVSAFKQTASLAQGFAGLSKTEVMKSAVAHMLGNPFKLKDNDVIQFVNSKSAMMENRGNDWEREVAEIMEKSYMKREWGTLSKWQKFKDISLKPMAFFDRATCSILWLAKYNGINNKTGNEEAAIEAADEHIRKTQPAGGILNLPASHRGGGLARAFTVFTNQLDQNWNLYVEIVKSHKGVATKENVEKAFWYSIVAPTLIYLAQVGFKPEKLIDDPEDWVIVAVNNIFGGLPVFNIMIDSFAKMVFKKIKEERTGEKERIFFTGIAPMTFSVLDDIRNLGIQGMQDIPEFIDDPTIGKITPTLKKVLPVAGKLTGAPYIAGQRIFKGGAQRAAEELKKGDPIDAVRNLIWSEYALKETDITKRKIKKLGELLTSDKISEDEYERRINTIIEREYK